MFSFKDLNDKDVQLYFSVPPESLDIKHVLAIVKHGEKYLCTEHKLRGIEFPGGKVEANETLVQAVKREVLEETGIHIEKEQQIGYYTVLDNPPFSKAIYRAVFQSIAHDTFLFETNARHWLTKEEIFASDKLSFYMKDEGMQKILQEVDNNDY